MINVNLSNDLNNPRQFWRKINALLGKMDSKSVNMMINNEITNDPEMISDAFSSHFSLTPKVLHQDHHPELLVNQPRTLSLNVSRSALVMFCRP